MHLLALLGRYFYGFLQSEVTVFPSLSYTSASEIPTLWSLKKVPFEGGASSGGSRPSVKEGGGVAGHSDPEIRGGSGLQKFFSALRASVWSKKKGGPGPFPESATGLTV